MEGVKTAGALAAACVLLASGPGRQAWAQTPPEGRGTAKPRPLHLGRETLGAAALGDVGRARMKGGDFAGALDAFDAALRTSSDPTLRRDRGICHEGLGHGYPAIDDYRAYVTARPDASDAESIRGRLAKLEQGALGYSSASTDVPGDVEGGAAAARPGSAPAGGPPDSPPARGRPADQLDLAVESDDDAFHGKLRKGKGFSLSPFFSEHKWGSGPGLIAFAHGAPSSFGDSSTWAECVGIGLRAALASWSAVAIEIGYEHFNSTAIDVAVVSGLTSQIGFELRFPLDEEYDNQVFVMPGIGYEHLVAQSNSAQDGSVSLGAFVPRVRVGLRHLLAPSAGIDFSLDGGAVNFFRYAKFPFESANPSTYLLAANVALVWGL